MMQFNMSFCSRTQECQRFPAQNAVSFGVCLEKAKVIMTNTLVHCTNQVSKLFLCLASHSLS